MYGLQRLCFGQLRPVEIEQLYEKAWFAVTETCLAMTIFREEVGAFFLVMFTALVTGKVWGWIGEGRVEVLEQQPPANPRVFHTRLTVSLLLSVLYDIWLLGYAFNTVVDQARPTMMVMFLFEFAVLTVCSFQTAFRYIVSLVEQRVVATQTRQRLEDRRRQVKEERDEILRRRELDGDDTPLNEGDLPNPDDIDEMDIEVPGWEEKGQWVLTLDLVAGKLSLRASAGRFVLTRLSDFVKLIIYTAFFCVLFTFYGLPIHIMRDWFMTTRSFLKRLGALIRYRQALKDMDQYPDATAEELSREDTCIICREEMRPWNPELGQVERTRPKKLPCGHILHFGCLKSWLERQQVCPTCRTPVVRDRQRPRGNGDALVFRFGLNIPAGQNQQQPPAPAANGEAPVRGDQPQAPEAPNNQNNRNNGVRMFNLGPLRLGFAQGGAQDIQDMAQRLGVPADVANDAAPAPAVEHQETNGHAPPSLYQLRLDLIEAVQRVQNEMYGLYNTAQELQIMNNLATELARLENMHGLAPAVTQQQVQQTTNDEPQPAAQQPPQLPPNGAQQHQLARHYNVPFQAPGGFGTPPTHIPSPFQQYGSLPPRFPQYGNPAHMPGYPGLAQQAPIVARFGAAGNVPAIPAGSPELPEGLVIPPGWSLLPLQRYEGSAPQVAPEPQVASGQGAQSSFQDMVSALAPELNAHVPRPVRPNTATVSIQSHRPTERMGTSAFEADGVTTGPSENGPSSLPGPVQAPPEATGEPRVPRAPPSSSGAAPEVTAPTPVMPNWGGTAQLFGNSNTVFGLQLGGAGDHSPTPSHQGETSAAAGEQQAEDRAAKNGEGSGSPAESEQNGSASSKGKSRAVTVEEAEDDDE